MAETGSSRPEFEIITAAQRIARDPRGLTRVTKLGEDSFVVKKAPEAQETGTILSEQLSTNTGDLGGGEDNG